VEKHGINSYRHLRVWQDAMTIAATAYELTRGFPREELFGLSSQISRSAATIQLRGTG
jgi:four helix bundle protein